MLLEIILWIVCIIALFGLTFGALVVYKRKQSLFKPTKKGSRFDRRANYIKINQNSSNFNKALLQKYLKK